MKPKMIALYMDMCERIAQMSVAERAKVGALIVRNNNILSFGWNGTPYGWTNECEHKEYMPADAGGWLDAEDILEQWPYTEESGHRYRMKSKQEVLHAETNAIAKVAQSSESCQDASLFCTHTPCMDCAKLIYQSGITTVYFKHAYDAAKGSGLEFLKLSGVTVEQI